MNMNLTQHQQYRIRFFPFQKFKSYQSFPRFPECNDDIRYLDEIDRESSLFIYISHRWLRGEEAVKHPDDSENHKFQLCIEGIQSIMSTVAWPMDECYLWFDYGCIDQDQLDPASEMEFLSSIIEPCDCLFTPIFSEEVIPYAKDGTQDWYDYKNPYWQDYLSRAWCRLEMVYAANIKTITDTRQRMNRLFGGLKLHRQRQRRPHFVYFHDLNLVPLNLPPLQHSYFDRFYPNKGHLKPGCESDMDRINLLMSRLRFTLSVSEWYEGEEIIVNEKKIREGKGFFSYPNGDTYFGCWKADKRHGFGVYTGFDGTKYSGQFFEDKFHGFGCLEYPDGAIYSGSFENGLKHGYGTLRWLDGRQEVGLYQNNNPFIIEGVSEMTGHIAFKP